MPTGEKKHNLYKVTVTIPGAQPNLPGATHTEYVRAKTKAGAVAAVASATIAAEIATTDDLIKLASIAVRETPKKAA